jgi:hypothetical protein
LKADSEGSFQPQTATRELVDIIPALVDIGISKSTLIASMTRTKRGKRSVGSKPFKLSRQQAQNLYQLVFDTAAIRIKGKDIESKHPQQ